MDICSDGIKYNINLVQGMMENDIKCKKCFLTSVYAFTGENSEFEEIVQMIKS